MEAGAGDFVHIPKHAVHRELNRTDAQGRLLIVRTGEGVPVFNVDGPEPPA